MNNNIPFYRQILGSSFESLPAPVQALHDSTLPRVWGGQATVARGRNPLAILTAKLFGFPPAGSDIPVTVTLAPIGDREHWARDFNGKTFASKQWAGAGPDQGLLFEQFGPISVAIALIIKDDKLYLIPKRWTCLGLPLPRFLLPKGDSFETAQGDHFCFDVGIEAPLIGLIVAYRGTLKQVS